jgi:hypothetical protein
MRFKKAFKCSRCPENNGENGCPMWWEMILKNSDTDETKITKACGFTQLPQMLALISTDTMHSVAASYDMRNKVIKNIGKVIFAINEKMNLEFKEEEIEEMSSIEDNDKKMIEDRGE